MATLCAASAEGVQGVEQCYWYIAIVKNSTEKVCAQRLQDQGYECYVPYQTEEHIWKDGRRKQVDRILLRSVVLLHVTPQERLQAIKNPFIFGFMVNRAAQPDKFGRYPVATVPERQIEHLRFMLYHSTQPVEIDATIRKGDKVRVCRGDLLGMEGIVKYDPNGKPRFCISLDILGYATVEIDGRDVEKI